jgi:uncharacterized damage-inducible protein DinB
MLAHAACQKGSIAGLRAGGHAGSLGSVTVGAMKAHFQRMAAYNRWANARLYEAVGKLSTEAFAAPRSGFFPSLLKTLNHILVGDTVWMGRLDGTGSSVTSLDQILHAELAALRTARAAMDARIVAFVDAVAPARLEQDLVYRTVAGDPMTTQVGQVLAHFFNHQTHHRGQAHAMLSSTDVAPPSLDLILFLRDHPEIAKMR